MTTEATPDQWQVEIREWGNRGVPESLMEALHDPFDYALCLRSGQVIRFSEAKIEAPYQWVTLVIEDYGFHQDTNIFPFPRGVDVRVTDISWVAKAPEGS